MKAQEVLSRYAAGEQDFRRVILRGRSFRGQDLSGADFSEADVRGTNFTNATLKDANFSKAEAGVQRRWLIAQLVFPYLLSILFYFASVLLNPTFTSYFFGGSWAKNYGYPVGTLVLLVAVITFFTIARQGLTTQAMEALAVVGAGAGVGSMAILGAIVVAGAVSGVDADAAVRAFAATIFLLFPYVTWRAQKGDEKFALVRTFSIVFGALGGTSFCGADLTKATFTAATLKSSNFNDSKQKSTILTHTCWKDAKKLDCARMGNSILADAAVRELLITRNGYKKSYIRTNLRGANLDGVNLEQANLTGADLSQATLH